MSAIQLKRTVSRHAVRTTLACALIAGIPAIAIATGSAPAAAATGGYVTYPWNGHTQSFTVPTAVTQITVLAVGASGGAGSNGPGSSGAAGGTGGSVSATVPVTPGQLLTIDVGYFGGDARGSSSGAGGGTPGFAQPYAGVGGLPSSSGGGGGGGGATAIQTGGVDSFPILVAGGGGGGGGGGAVVGENGGGGAAGGQPPGGSGGDGTGSGAGSGGAGGRSAYLQGDNGQTSPPFSSSGAGGGGGFGVNPKVITNGKVGGGGAGGNAGGAGGGGGGGGGAGSSYVESTVIGTPTFATATTHGTGQLSIFWGAPTPITTLSASPSPARPGTVTVSAMVAPPARVTSPTPTGTVSFFLNDATTPTATATLSGGEAATNLTLLSTGMYTVRAVYSGDGVYDTSATSTTTTIVDPTVSTGAPSRIGPTTATLTGTVNPNGVATPVQFEYGTSTAYGHLTATQNLPVGSAPVAVQAALTGLQAGTLYHYRLLVPPTLSTSPFYGNDATFTTSASGSVSVTTATLGSATIGRSYTATLAGTGGMTPYQWSLASGALPAGLTLNPATGTIVGTPTRIGSTSFTIGLKDSAAPTPATSTKSLTLAVNPVPVMITTALLPVATQGRAYTAQLTATGGVSPYHWSISAGSLPAGLALNPTTGAITGTPPAVGSASFTIKVADSTAPAALTDTAGLAAIVQTRVAPSVYVVNGGFSGVDSFDLNASGNLTPRSQITGSSTGLQGTTGVSIDAAGQLYVTSAGNNSVTEFANDATGNATPTATIAGRNTGLSGPQADTLDSAGRLYVANQTANTVTVYAKGAVGNAAPVLTLGGPNTRLAGPQSLAIDAVGHLFVGNANNTITEYAVSASGDAAPLTTIGGPDTGINSPQGLTIDAAGNLLVASTYGERLTEYPPTARGDAPPLRVISGSATGLDFPDGVDVDTAGNIYVANQFGNDITVYAANAIGNPTPIETIAGSNTGLSSPGHLAVAPPLSVLTRRLPTGTVRHRYRATLRAGLGTPPYRWRVSHGRLPRGLRLNAVTGRIAGTPRVWGTFRITVSVRDCTRPTMHARRKFTLTVRRYAVRRSSSVPVR